jgi:hypothetical protein
LERGTMDAFLFELHFFPNISQGISFQRILL